jgi:hypothetical protein
MREMSDASAVYDEPADWIVDQAQQQSVKLSRRKLADWHRAGLIPKPDREFLGGPDGSESAYPGGTLRQVIACSILMKQFGSVERVGWELWMRGFPVAEQYWRDPLRQAHEMFQLFLSVAASADDDDDLENTGPEQSEAADRVIETVGELSETPLRLGVARRRLRRDGFKEFLGIVISTAIGAFTITEGETGELADPTHILSRLLGVTPGRHKAAVPPSPLLSVTGRALAENLEAMAQFLPRIASSISPDTITESAFASAREELTFLAHSYLSVRQNEARIAPGSTPDLALLRQLFERLGPKEQAALLLIWLAVRSIPGWRENLDVLRQAYPRGNYGWKA